ncbi:MAG: hypothetical protein CMH47_18575 [Muricauda sp.]|nr:hypothetical protein [Allomuricauda sp.]|tara:strand:- start:201 stop:3596 length:3396 start_codon:yes stop_codon:yes gene_type:complete
MTNKNINQGEITTESGDVHIGDKITNLIDGLSLVLHEYKQQLKSIEQLINDFKPRTALKLLEEIELRITENGINDNLIQSKILFLKATCKSELFDYPIQVTANEFIQSYLLAKDDKRLKEKACVEYLNLDDEKKSLELVDEILRIDEYNLNAWYVKIITSQNLKSAIREVPKVIFENYDFKLNIAYWVLGVAKREFAEEWERLGLKVSVDVEKYKKLTFQNKHAWIVALDLFINKIFNDFPIRYVAGKNFVFQDEDIIDDAIKFLENFIAPLEESEIQESIYHQKFFYNYFQYYSTKEGRFLDELETIYSKLPKLNWFYTMTYCQAINHNGNFQKSIQVIQEYEDKGGEKISELFLFKTSLLFLSGKRDGIPQFFDEYLNTVNIIDEPVGFNILNAFLNPISSFTSEQEFKKILDSVFKKNFKSEDLKNLFQITCEIRYTKDINEHELFDKLTKLSKVKELDQNYKDLLAENFQNIGRTEEAVKFIGTYLDKTKVSPSLRFYIVLLEKLLTKNKESGRGIYKELLDLLSFYRLNSKEPDEHLLGIEHNLNLAKNDWENLKEIDIILFQSFPNNELYLLFYLLCLEKLNLLEELKEVSETIPTNFENVSVGIQVSKLLLRNKVYKEKGAQIMYNLAIDPSNTEARKLFFGIAHLFNADFFRQFEFVEKGVWVKYSINSGVVEEVKITKVTGIQKELLGRKVGDKFSIEQPLTGNINVIEVLNIYNDALKLNYDIQKEAQNPMNDLGFAALQFPEKIEDFEDFLVKQFGPKQSQENAIREKHLNDYYNYRIGFTEVSRSVFNNPVEAYLALTHERDKKFTTIPLLITPTILEETEFTLDFTSLLLFYQLEQNLDFNFKIKFKISYLIKDWVKLLLVEEKSSRGPFASLNIDTKGIKRYLVPEDYKDNRINFFESVLNWIEENCVVDLVEEKLDIAYQLEDNMDEADLTMKLMVDNMHFALRENNHLITSDSTLYLFQAKSKLKNNIISPEKFLLHFHATKCDTEFYRFLLKTNYIGVDINLDTLKNEFFALLSGNENYYGKCLENLSYSVHNNPEVINVTSKFLKGLYLMESVTIENKNLHSFELFKSTFYSMPESLIRVYRNRIVREFTLLGNYYDEVLKMFDSTKSLFNSK